MMVLIFFTGEMAVFPKEWELRKCTDVSPACVYFIWLIGFVTQTRPRSMPKVRKGRDLEQLLCWYTTFETLLTLGSVGGRDSGLLTRTGLLMLKLHNSS